MTRNLIVAVVLFAGLAMTTMSANACNPKQDPGCDNRSADVAAAPAPCDPKTDPGCN